MAEYSKNIIIQAMDLEEYLEELTRPGRQGLLGPVGYLDASTVRALTQHHGLHSHDSPVLPSLIRWGSA
ncbi:MAG: hypothetical protein ACLFVU_08845 [Phycisphaerae bacterium]